MTGGGFFWQLPLFSIHGQSSPFWRLGVIPLKYDLHPKTEKKLEDFNFQKKSKRNSLFLFFSSSWISFKSYFLILPWWKSSQKILHFHVCLQNRCKKIAFQVFITLSKLFLMKIHFRNKIIYFQLALFWYVYGFL